jgi:hypothetical protein
MFIGSRREALLRDEALDFVLVGHNDVDDLGLLAFDPCELQNVALLRRGLAPSPYRSA